MDPIKRRLLEEVAEHLASIVGKTNFPISVVRLGTIGIMLRVTEVKHDKKRVTRRFMVQLREEFDGDGDGDGKTKVDLPQ